MTNIAAWWVKPRRISVVVDNPSWFLPYAETLVTAACADGDHAILCRSLEEVREGAVAFYLSCLHVTPAVVLRRNRLNVVVHASDLPKGRGFSPLSWQVEEGKNDITVCLFEATEELDAGPIVYREIMHFEGHELLTEMRDVGARLYVDLCLRLLAEPSPPEGVPQRGEPTFYPRRTNQNNRLDPNKSLAEQFNKLRVSDNERFPAFFDWRDHRYIIRIEKA